MPMRLLFVSGSYQNYQNGIMINQLIDDGMGGGGSVLGAGGYKEISSTYLGC
jgi:hypothetical protein